MKRVNINSHDNLPKKLLPVIYFDSCVLIDYFMAEQQSAAATDGENQAIRGLLKPQRKRTPEAIFKIRNKLINNKARKIAVISPLCLLELVETYGEEKFGQKTASATSFKRSKRMGKKDIGQYLKKLSDSLADGSTKKPLRKDFFDTAVNINPLTCRGLDGLYIADISDFCLTYRMINEWLAILSYWQMGAADIMHILFAQHLHCAYFASWDSDFEIAKNWLEKHEINLLSTTAQILEVL